MGLALALLTGCPFIPQLSVTPLTLALGGTATSANFRIENAGGGTLNYTASEDLPWIDIAAAGGKQDGAVEGSITNEVAFIQVTLNRSALPAQGVVRGEISVTSNGGNQTVIVSATQSGQPLLQVSRTAVDFGLTGATEQFTITNGGNAQLDWTLAFPATATWLSVQPRTGVLESFGKQTVVTVNVSRTGMAAQADPYTTPISIVSNGGTAGVAVSMNVPPFSVQPNSVDFGRTDGVTSKSLTVENNGTLPVVLAVTATTDTGGNWLTVNNASPTLPAPGPLQVVATANGTGLAPGNYTGSIKVEAPALAYSQVVPVTVSVPGFTVAPATLAFGAIGDPATLPLTLTNLGSTPIQWTATIPANIPWLSISANSGTLAATQTINVTATPGTVNPGQYAAQISFTFDGGQDTVNVSMSRPKPAALKVAPQDMDFGVTRTETTVGIWNDGLGTVNWSIDTSGFPAWLSLSPVNGSGIASGTVSGDTTDTVTVRVNRSLAPPALLAFDFTFNVTASGDSTKAVPVRVRASAPQLPEFGLLGEGVDAFGVPYVRLDITENTQDFFVVNTGDGTLNWNIPTGTVIPAWITSISLQQGTVDPGRQQPVRITVDRTTLSRAGATFRLPVASNDPARPLLLIEIQIRVPYTIQIGAGPESIAFGRFANTGIMTVANTGDAGEYLNFKITSSQPDWLFVEPATGRSIGVRSGLPKDTKEISVAIDRSRISGQGGVAKLIIEATNVPEDALPVPPVEVQVSVDLAKLTIETAVNQLRPPSLVRLNVLLRDQAYRSFPAFEDNFTDTRTFYNVPNVLANFLENSLPIDPDETNTFVKKNESLSFDVLVMLDFSGSMRAAAQALVDDGQLPAGGDPLNELYLRCIAPMLAEFPPHYRVGLSVFNERRPSFESDLRIIYGADAAHPQFAADALVRDKDVLQYRISHMDVKDNGATALLPAVFAGAATLAGIDSNEHYIPFDTAAEPILVAVTDGRRTTPPGDVSPVADYMMGTRVRFFPIGWGQAVNANTLILLSSGSGGHFYSPQAKKNADGISVPQLSELLKWSRTEPGNASAQSLPRDLRSHVSLSYPSLNGADSVALEARVDVLDTTPPINSSVTFSGVPMSLYANDVRLGQIGMRTEGISPGTDTSVFVYMDYAPRNLARLGLQLSVESIGGLDALTSTVITTAEEKGGLLEGWTRTDAGNQFTFTGPAGRVFRYGDYGELVEVRVSGAVHPFKVRLAVVDPVIGTDRDGKYFTYPDTITVSDKTFKATSFPRPRMFSIIPNEGFISPQKILDLPAGQTAYSFNVYNLGGAHAPTDVKLYWTAGFEGSILPGTTIGKFLINPVLGGNVVSTETPGTLSIKPDLTLEPGVYSGALMVDFNYGSLNLAGVDGLYYLRYTIAPPSLKVSLSSLDFGTASIDLPLTVSNDAQGMLIWSVDPATLPVWLEVLNTGTVLGPNESVTFNVRVNRDAVASGDYNTTFTITGDNGQSQVVQVHMTKP
jgi:hypothetical protein